MYGDLYGVGSEEYDLRMMEMNEVGRFRTGITRDERRLIAERYAFARDIKVLALGAELSQHEGSIDKNSGDITLPSGTHMVFDAENEGVQNILAPHLWEKRRQLKDRVYEISANESKFILKERKTDRHTDTKRHGHKPGRTSSEEFSIGRHLQESGGREAGDIVLSFEESIGFASYPDGFQFSVFGFEEGLQPEAEVSAKLEQEILAHRDQFEEEYRLIQEHLIELINDLPFMERYQKRLGPYRGKLPETTILSFEDFARLKALRLKRSAYSLFRENIVSEGFTNGDRDGYAFKVHSNGNVKLEIIGLDF
jgi:hypothetical protein